MACELETTQEAACESGIGKLDSPIVLLQIIAQLTCELADSGGGGLAPANIVSVGSPVGVVTPDAIGQFYTALNLFGVGQHGLFQAIGATSADWVEWI